MASRRRKEYLPQFDPRFKVYNETYDQLRAESTILRGEKVTNAHSLVDWTKRGVEVMLLQWKGNEEGEYWRHDERFTAKLPLVKAEIEKISRRFITYKKEQAKVGNRVPKEMPKELFEKLQYWHAKQDCLLEEIDFLESLLQGNLEEEEKVSSEMLLKYGPIGTGKLIGGILSFIDGQKCDWFEGKEEPIRIIRDKNSPYDGMAVADYKEFVIAPWNYATMKIDSAKSSLYRKLAAQRAEDEFSEAWSQKHAELFEQYPEWKDLFAVSFKGKRIPIFPKNCKNYLKDENKIVKV